MSRIQLIGACVIAALLTIAALNDTGMPQPIGYTHQGVPVYEDPR